MKRNTANEDLRIQIMQRGLFYWQVAKRVGISPTTLTVWLRDPLPQEDPRRKQIIAALEGTGQDGKQKVDGATV